MHIHLHNNILDYHISKLGKHELNHFYYNLYLYLLDKHQIHQYIIQYLLISINQFDSNYMKCRFYIFLYYLNNSKHYHYNHEHINYQMNLQMNHLNHYKKVNNNTKYQQYSQRNGKHINHLHNFLDIISHQYNFGTYSFNQSIHFFIHNI